MEKVKEYYPQMDIMKGIAIFLMVMGHVIPWTLGEPNFLHLPLCEVQQNEAWNSIVYKVIYSFHMPLLFFVSGFLFYKPFDKSAEYLKTLIVKRASRLLVPYLFTGTLLFLARDHWGYWFLQDLFVMNILVGILQVLCKNMNKKAEFIVFGLFYVGLFIFNKFSTNLYNQTNGVIVISNLYMYYPAFILGLLCRKYPGFYFYIQKEFVCLIALVVYMAIFVCREYNVSGGNFLGGLIMPLAMIIFLNAYCLKWKIKCGGAIIVGKYSLEIYILHLFFIMVFSQVGNFMLHMETGVTVVTFQIVYSVALSLIAIVLSIVVANLIDSNIILKRLFFGK